MEINREIMQQLRQWKDDPDRKPALLKGARQIGKTWLMETFGRECFDYCIKLDFDNEPDLRSMFQMTKDPTRLIKEMELYFDQPIIAGRTLLIFDEIQECEEALNSLKYFCEKAPEYHVISAGSLLGVAVKKRHMSVPVGKVDIFRIYPISFREYLHVADTDTARYVDSLNEIRHLPEIVLNKLQTEYRRYQVCGGMPAAISALLENKGMNKVESCLQNILELYELDFSKYVDPLSVVRLHSLWHSLPTHLSKENRKFVYNAIRTGARSKDYEDALIWLEEAGIIYRIFDITKPDMPLSAYQQHNAFKVYACDCGLLRRLAHLPANIIINPIANYTEFKGAIAENAVLQSIVPLLDVQIPNYWTSERKAEVEFIIQWGSDIIPIEVKAETNISGKSLTEYYKKYAPRYRIRFSMKNMQFNEGLFSCPAPLAAWLDKWMPMLGLGASE